MGVPLRIAEPGGRCRRFLRRYRSGGLHSCPAGGYCNANSFLAEIPWADRRAAAGDDWPHDDPGWPRGCERCPYQFTDTDCWQRHDDRVYLLPDGTEVTWWGNPGDAVPPGTMIRADWYDAYSRGRGDSWLVVLPGGGTWITTQEASGGGHWTVTGVPPQITATPSIWHAPPGGWHGWIRDGELTTA